VSRADFNKSNAAGTSAGDLGLPQGIGNNPEDEADDGKALELPLAADNS